MISKLMLNGWFTPAKKKPALSFWGYNPEYGPGGDITDNVGATGRITGSAQSDIMSISDSMNITIDAGAGDDIVTIANSSGTLFGRAGGDIIDAFHFAGTIDGGSGGDAITMNHGSGKILAGSGDDTIVATGYTGTVDAGVGADIVMLTDFSGTVDFGKDRHGDIVFIYGDSPNVTFKNYDPTRDILYWEGHEDVIA